MREVIYSVAISLDGYIADVNGGVDWLERARRNARKGEDFGMGAFFRSVDTVLLGRKTYEVAVKMGAKDTVFRQMKHYVFSRTLTPGEHDGVEVVGGDPGKLVRELKEIPGKNIWLCGGGELAREFIKAKLLDEISLAVMPLLLGGGVSAFPEGFPVSELELSECKQYSGGVVALTYKLTRAHVAAG